MAFRLLENQTADDGVKRIVREQIDRAIAEIDDHQLGSHDTIHQVRKRCKKIRAMLRLVRPRLKKAYDRENSWYRDAARRLSLARDVEAQIECYDELVDCFRNQIDQGRLAPIRGALVRRRHKIESVDGAIRECRRDMIAGRARVDDWPLAGRGFDLLAEGLKKTFRRGRRAMHNALSDPTPERFHEWRKRTKYHWYHARVLRDIWTPLMQAYRDELDRLADYLGDDHDLAVLGHTLRTESDEFGDRSDVEVVVGLIERRRADLESEAVSLGGRVFGEKPKRMVARFRCYWNQWREEASAPQTEEDTS